MWPLESLWDTVSLDVEGEGSEEGPRASKGDVCPFLSLSSVAQVTCPQQGGSGLPQSPQTFSLKDACSSTAKPETYGQRNSMSPGKEKEYFE